jgi:hypothetical protein
MESFGVVFLRVKLDPMQKACDAEGTKANCEITENKFE